MLKIVVGSNMPSPRGFNGAIGCRESTTNPKMNSATVKITIARTYCFQSCGPVSTRLSNHRRTRGARYLPSISQAK